MSVPKITWNWVLKEPNLKNGLSIRIIANIDCMQSDLGPSAHVWNRRRSSFILGLRGRKILVCSSHCLKTERDSAFWSRNVLTLRRTGGIKKNLRNSHFAHNSESENIWDCSSCRVCASCDCATMPSPHRPLIHYLFTSSIRAAACLVQDDHVLLFIVLK